MSKSTLDVYHQQVLDNISSINNELIELKNELTKINSEIDEVELYRQSNSEKVSQEDIDNNINLIDKRILITDRITLLTRKSNETTYYTNTADILYKYYDLVEKGKGNISFNSIENENTIMKYFKSDKVKTEPENNDKTRGNLLDDYMSLTEKNYYKVKNINIEDKCIHCNSSNIISMIHDGYKYCSKCYSMDNLIIDHDKPSYKDPPKEITYFSYKRINHLNEWLNQIQGKETTEIPDEIYERILLEIKKQRITNMADLTNDRIKMILKQMKVHKYYEHIPHIMNRLNGLSMPIFSSDLEEKLRSMFKQIQSPFLKHSPPKRKNFLSYSYVLHKFLQLLEKDEYLPFFPLLKSRDKLSSQDSIWKLICEEVGWEFIPSL
jgi:hypothetical protein